MGVVNADLNEAVNRKLAKREPFVVIVLIGLNEKIQYPLAKSALETPIPKRDDPNSPRESINARYGEVF